MDLALSNGLIFREGKLRKENIGIANGKIKLISRKKIPADKEVNCKGKIVLPGCIDMHVHFRDFNEKQKGTWKTESAAALHGGVTTVFDMPNNKGFLTTSKRKLLRKIKHAKKNSLANFGVYFGISEKNIGELGKVKDLCAGFKLYMARTTGNLVLNDFKVQRKALKKVAKTRKVVVVHAEDEEIIDFFTEFFSERKDFLVHADNRPNVAEGAAIVDLIQLAKETGARVHVTHMSTKQAYNGIRSAKKKNKKITCDTTLNYLSLTEKDLEEKGAFAKINPPLRLKSDQKMLWKGLNNGTIDCISTDHSPHSLAEKKKPFRKAPPGFPSIDYYLPVMLDAVNKGKIKLKRVVQVCCENPARILGVKKRGAVKKGYFADLVVADMKRKQRVSKRGLLTKVKWSPYTGMKLKGAVEKTIVNGNIVFDRGKIYNRFKGNFLGEGK